MKDDHDPLLDEAEYVSKALHAALIEAFDAIEKLMEIRDISALATLPAGTRGRHQHMLTEMKEHTRNLVAYCDMQVAALGRMGMERGHS